MNKKAMAWGLIVAIILGLLLLIILLGFSTNIKDKIIEGIQHFIENVLGR